MKGAYTIKSGYRVPRSCIQLLGTKEKGKINLLATVVTSSNKKELEVMSVTF